LESAYRHGTGQSVQAIAMRSQGDRPSMVHRTSRCTELGYALIALRQASPGVQGR